MDAAWFQGEAHILARTGLVALGDALFFAALGRTRPGLGAVLGSPEAADSVRAGLALCDVLASGAAPPGASWPPGPDARLGTSPRQKP